MLICRADIVLGCLFLEVVESHHDMDGREHRGTLFAEFCAVDAPDFGSRSDLLGSLGERLLAISADEGDYRHREHREPVRIDDMTP